MIRSTEDIVGGLYGVVRSETGGLTDVIVMEVVQDMRGGSSFAGFGGRGIVPGELELSFGTVHDICLAMPPRRLPGNPSIGGA